MMNKALAWAPLLLLISLPAQARTILELPASEEQLLEATKANEACLSESAARFDDGISDARTIAIPVASSCRESTIYVAVVYGIGQNDQVKQGIIEGTLSRALDSATEVVIISRSKRRKVAQQPPAPAP
jgi:hypothetical protein